MQTCNVPNAILGCLHFISICAIPYFSFCVDTTRHDNKRFVLIWLHRWYSRFDFCLMIIEWYRVLCRLLLYQKCNECIYCIQMGMVTRCPRSIQHVVECFYSSYLLGLLAKIKCSISSSQPDLWDWKYILPSKIRMIYEARISLIWFGLVVYCQSCRDACIVAISLYGYQVISVLQYIRALPVVKTTHYNFKNIPLF